MIYNTMNHREILLFSFLYEVRGKWEEKKTKHIKWNAEKKDKPTTTNEINEEKKFTRNKRRKYIIAYFLQPFLELLLGM